MINFNPPKWSKRKMDQLNQARIEILHQMNLDDLIAARSVFFRSGEVTNAEELVYHVLDEFIMERQEELFDALRQKLKSRIPPEKIGYYMAVLGSEYEEELDATLNRLTQEFLKEYSIDGRIGWRKLAGI